jgi:hypothetical protein
LCEYLFEYPQLALFAALNPKYVKVMGMAIKAGINSGLEVLSAYELAHCY